MTALMAAGAEADAKWKSCPIGGEIRPEAWGKVFDPIPGMKAIQDFRTCVETTHVSWLMDSGMFGKKASTERIARAGVEVRRMGYEFHIPEVTIGRVMDGSLEVNLKLENRGVAPFYYDWKPEYQLLAKGKPVRTSPGSGKLTGLLPGDNPRVWTDTITVSGIPPGKYTLAVRVTNPLKSGKPMRFANMAQDIDSPGFLSLGEVDIP